MKLEIPTKQEPRVSREDMQFKDIKGFRKKVQYIWDYYRNLFFGIVIISVLMVSLVSSIYENIKYDTILQCALINNTLMEESAAYWVDTFSEYYDLDENSQKIFIDSGFTIDYSNSENSDLEGTYVSIQKLSAMIAARMLDCAIADEQVISMWAKDGTFLNLEEVLPPDVLASVSDYLVYYTSYSDETDTVGTTAAYALDLSTSHLVTNGRLYLDPPLLGLVVNSKHPDVVIEFIKFAYGL